MIKDDIRTIKKYPNRRLYDTFISSYVTLEDIRKLVLEKVNFEVIEARTGQSLTHNILLQIVTWQEGNKRAILSSSFLKKLIALYESASVQENLTRDLEVLVSQQHYQLQAESSISQQEFTLEKNSKFKLVKRESDFIVNKKEGKE